MTARIARFQIEPGLLRISDEQAITSRQRSTRNTMTSSRCCRVLMEAADSTFSNLRYDLVARC
jgi:hypothetical protein